MHITQCFNGAAFNVRVMLLCYHHVTTKIKPQIELSGPSSLTSSSSSKTSSLSAPQLQVQFKSLRNEVCDGCPILTLLFFQKFYSLLRTFDIMGKWSDRAMRVCIELILERANKFQENSFNVLIHHMCLYFNIIFKVCC